MISSTKFQLLFFRLDKTFIEEKCFNRLNHLKGSNRCDHFNRHCLKTLHSQGLDLRTQIYKVKYFMCCDFAFKQQIRVKTFQRKRRKTRVSNLIFIDFSYNIRWVHCLTMCYILTQLVIVTIFVHSTCFYAKSDKSLTITAGYRSSRKIAFIFVSSKRT